MLTPKQEENTIILIGTMLSGAFDQCRKRLHEPKTRQFDVLGISAVIAGFTMNKITGEFFFGNHADERSGCSSKYALPVAWFKNQYGISSTELVYLNDDCRWSFTQLAFRLTQNLSNVDLKAELQAQLKTALRLESERQSRWVAGLPIVRQL